MITLKLILFSIAISLTGAQYGLSSYNPYANSGAGTFAGSRGQGCGGYPPPCYQPYPVRGGCVYPCSGSGHGGGGYAGGGYSGGSYGGGFGSVAGYGSGFGGGFAGGYPYYSNSMSAAWTSANRYGFQFSNGFFG